MLKDINISGVAEACDKIQQRTISHEGCMHSSVRAFDSCMRMFDTTKCFPVEAVTFKVFLNVPIMQEGRAKVHRDGQLEMWTV